jgi:hypothetical protein
MEREGRSRVGGNTWGLSASRYARVFAVVCGGIQVELDLVIIVPASMKRVKVQPWMLAVLTGQRLLLGDQILMFELGGCDNAG